MVVEYTDLAKASLRDISNYVIENFSPTIAKRVTDAILDKAEALAFMPTIGKALDGKLAGLRCL